jgi:nitroreductase
MDVFEAISKRRSVRLYEDYEMPNEDLLKILEAARLAPSARNLQPWRFIVVKDKETKDKLGIAALNQQFIADASVIIAVISDPEESPRWYLQDPMIAVEHMCLEAVELGYGTCWIGAFSEDKVKKILKIPNKFKVICLLPIGKPAESPRPRRRKPLEDIVFSEYYGNKFKIR